MMFKVLIDKLGNPFLLYLSDLLLMKLPCNYGIQVHLSQILYWWALIAGERFMRFRYLNIKCVSVMFRIIIDLSEINLFLSQSLEDLILFWLYRFIRICNRRTPHIGLSLTHLVKSLLLFCVLSLGDKKVHALGMKAIEPSSSSSWTIWGFSLRRPIAVIGDGRR